MIHFTRTKTVENAKHWLSSFAIWLTLTHIRRRAHKLHIFSFFRWFCWMAMIEWGKCVRSNGLRNTSIAYGDQLTRAFLQFRFFVFFFRIQVERVSEVINLQRFCSFAEQPLPQWCDVKGIGCRPMHCVRIHLHLIEINGELTIPINQFPNKVGRRLVTFAHNRSKTRFWNDLMIPMDASKHSKRSRTDRNRLNSRQTNLHRL